MALKDVLDKYDPRNAGANQTSLGYTSGFEPKIYDMGKGQNVGKIDEHLRNFISSTLEKGSTDAARLYCEDPTTVGFNLFFYFDYRSPLLNSSDKGENAVKYLEGIGEVNRAASLTSFRKRLNDLMVKFPYYFQQLSGLDNIYEFDPKNAIEERVLEVKTLESLDMKVAGMMHDYIQATWDFEYRRHILPANMREFELSVLVTEIRNIRTFVNETSATGSQGKFEDINDKLAVFEYFFTRCEFDFRKGNAFLSDLNNATSEAVANSFKITCGQLKDLGHVPIFDLGAEIPIVNENPNQHDPKNKLPGGNDKRGTPQNTVGGYSSRTFSLPAFKAKLAATASNAKGKSNELASKFESELQNQASQLKAKYFDNVAGGLVSQANWGNIFFRAEKPSLEGLISGDQTLGDINPVKGKTGNLKDALTSGVTSAFTGKIIDEINSGKNFSGGPDQTEQMKRLNEILSANLPGFIVDPFSTLLNQTLITTLGQMSFTKP